MATVFTRRYVAGAVLSACLLAAFAGAQPTLGAATSPTPPPKKPAATVKPQATKTQARSAQATATKQPQSKPATSTKGMTPDQVVKAYLAYRDRGDDDRSYALLSEASKKQMSDSEWRERARGVRASLPSVLDVAGQALFIGGGTPAESKVAKPTIKGNEATVKVQQYVQIPSVIVLVKENGEWRVDLKRTMGIEDEQAKPTTTASTSSTTSSPSSSTPTSTTATPPPPPDTGPTCKANVRVIAQAFQVYALNNNGMLPDASNWTDAIAPYLPPPVPDPNVTTKQYARVLKCPGDTIPNHTVTFAMNAKLSGKRLSDIPDLGRTVLLYESTTGKPNESGTGETIPSPPRHTSGNVYLMADGSVLQMSQKPAF